MLEDTIQCAWCLRELKRIPTQYDNDQHRICDMHRKREERARQAIVLRKASMHFFQEVVRLSDVC